MSIYDKASLVHIPSGVKSGTLYNVLPNNADGDFDFTRSSTATRVNKDGLIEDVAIGVPRLDYPLLDGVVQDCPALLLEPAATNVITNSNIFNANANVSVDINNTISPDGSINAVKVTGNSGTSLKLVDANGAASGTYVISVFAKKDTHNFIQLGTGALGTYANFDLNNGVSSSNGSIQDYGNGWYRCSFQQITGAPSSHYISLIDNMSATRLVNSSTTNSVFLYGFQSENSSHITSYIPTSGSAVTRSADAANGAEANFNDSEGVLYANIATLANDGTYRVISISDGTLDNRVTFYFRPEANWINFRVRTDITGTPTDSINNIIVAPNSLEFNKVALKYKQNDFAIWLNGIKLVTDTFGDVFTVGTLTKVNFDRSDGVDDFYGNTKELMTFNTALTDSELEALTSYSSFNEMATEQLYTIE